MLDIATELVIARLKEARSNLKTTVLHRPGGMRHQQEVNLLVGKLMTEASQHPKFPEYIILFGHHTKEETLRAIMGGIAYTATQVTGVDSERLPFNPGWTQ